MILVDANLLIYAHVSDFEQHEAARQWLDGQINGLARVGLPWESLLAFVRITTNHRVFNSPTGVLSAWQQVHDWLGAPAVWIPKPTERHAELLELILVRDKVSGNHVPDAHLAALAIEHGLTLCSTDADFSRYADLHWRNPLE